MRVMCQFAKLLLMHTVIGLPYLSLLVFTFLINLLNIILKVSQNFAVLLTQSLSHTHTVKPPYRALLK